MTRIFIFIGNTIIKKVISTKTWEIHQVSVVLCAKFNHIQFQSYEFVPIIQIEDLVDFFTIRYCWLIVFCFYLIYRNWEIFECLATDHTSTLDRKDWIIKKCTTIRLNIIDREIFKTPISLWRVSQSVN